MGSNIPSHTNRGENTYHVQMPSSRQVQALIMSNPPKTAKGPGTLRNAALEIGMSSRIRSCNRSKIGARTRARTPPPHTHMHAYTHYYVQLPYRATLLPEAGDNDKKREGKREKSQSQQYWAWRCKSCGLENRLSHLLAFMTAVVPGCT